MSNKLDKILVEISAGELIDKITILEIKKEKIKDQEKLKLIENEYNSLKTTLQKQIKSSSELTSLFKRLKEVNSTLWDIEEGKRESEKKQDFGDNFIKLARNVYIFNNKRAEIKKKINLLLGSNIIEVKSSSWESSF